jgi:hypothetical protein
MENRSARYHRPILSANNEKPFALKLAGTADPPPGLKAPMSMGVTITPSLRTSGLLFSLPAQELKNLIYLLSFASAYGLGRPTTQQLSHAMQVSETRARSRMDRLTQFLWNGKHLAFRVRRMDGQDAYSVSKDILAFIEPRPVGGGKAPQPPSSDTERQPRKEADQPTSVRDVIVARSRAKYSRPREEVERSIAQQMGWPVSGSTTPKADEYTADKPVSQLRKRLVEAGIIPRVADALVDRYPEETIRKQLDWLPYRKAKDPARLLTAAIEGSYAQPLALKRKNPLPTSKSNSQ